MSGRPLGRGLPGPGPVALTLLALAAGSAEAQEIAGVALGPDGQPLPGVPVVVHRVDATRGAMAGADTTGPAGEFRFPLPARDSAIYFAALRYEGRLYVGPAVAAGGPVDDYVLEVGPSTEAGAVGAALSGSMRPAAAQADPARTRGDSSSDAGALVLAGLLAAGAAGVFVYTAPRLRERRTREAVMEVAGIENRLAAAELSPAERERLVERRDHLKGQLAPRD